jgi:glycosyltransferase involved in cell wall biosynthesis
MAHIVISANKAWNIAHFRAPIVEALRQRGDKVTVVASADGSERELLEQGCDFVNVTFDAKGGNLLRDGMLLFSLQQQYSRLSPSIILNFTIKPVIYGTIAARLLNIPTLNTITGLGTAFIGNKWLTHLVEGLYKISLHGSGPVVFQNQEDLKLFRERRLIGHNQCIVVPGSGIDLEGFPFRALPDGSCVTFLMIARLIADKGVREYVEAARIAKRERSDARFCLLGPQGVANRTAISAQELNGWVSDGSVEYMGEAADVRPFIADAHCVVLPSYREGMPRVLLEAAAMGRPLIAADVPGCRDVVEEGGNGYLCAPRDAWGLANKIKEFFALSKDEKQDMGRRSRAKAETQFDVKFVVKQYLNLIDAQADAVRKPPEQVIVPAR